MKELSDILGSSHQNVKQILLKLEKKGFIQFQQDETDKRKQRIVLTDYCMEFCKKNDGMSRNVMNDMFEGVTQKDIETTIQTIIHIENNLIGRCFCLRQRSPPETRTPLSRFLPLAVRVISGRATDNRPVVYS